MASVEEATPSWQVFETLRSRYGNTSSWAIWEEMTGGSAVAGPGFDRPAIFDSANPEDYDAQVSTLRAQGRSPRCDIALVALNFAERPDQPPLPDFGAFHERARNDRKLRKALQAAGAEGCYITDLVKLPLPHGTYETSPLRLTNSGQVKVSVSGMVTVPAQCVPEHFEGLEQVGKKSYRRPVDETPREAQARRARQGRRATEQLSLDSVRFDTAPAFFHELDELMNHTPEHHLLLVPIGSTVKRVFNAKAFRRKINDHFGTDEHDALRVEVSPVALPHYSNWGSSEHYVQTVSARWGELRRSGTLHA